MMMMMMMMMMMVMMMMMEHKVAGQVLDMGVLGPS